MKEGERGRYFFESGISISAAMKITDKRYFISQINQTRWDKEGAGA